MLEKLKFVKGGIGKGKTDISMKHFRIRNGRILATNGIIGLSSPLPVGLDCQPDALQLTKAINQCDSTPTLTLTDGGRLRVAAGKFKAFVNCYAEPLPGMVPEGIVYKVDSEKFLSALDKTLPFICSDPAHPWSNGVLVRGQSLFATNNIAIVEVWLGESLGADINIPVMCVDKLLSVGEPFKSIQVARNSVTFHYEDGRWIKSLLLDTLWPDVSKAFSRNAEPQSLPEGFAEALSNISSFKEKSNRIYLSPGVMRTSGNNEEGASYDLESLVHSGIYRYDMLKAVCAVSTQIDISAQPVLFFGDSLRGALMGYRE